MLQRVLIAYTSRPPTIEYLRSAFGRRGIAVEGVYADENTLFDRFVIHRLNKLAHNFRHHPEEQVSFRGPSWAHMNYRSSRLRSAIRAFDPDLVLLIRGMGFSRVGDRRRAAKFGWWVEADERVQEALAEVPWFDRFFFSSISASVEAARRAGYRHTAYLAHAVDPAVFRPLEGVAQGSRFLFRRAVVEEAPALHPGGAGGVGKRRGLWIEVVSQGPSAIGVSGAW